jgi:hypothetical protein
MEAITTKSARTKMIVDFSTKAIFSGTRWENIKAAKFLEQHESYTSARRVETALLKHVAAY